MEYLDEILTQVEEVGLQGILDVAPCWDHKDVRQFIGVCNFIKNHTPRLAQIMVLLTNLTKKEVCFHWRPEQQEVFNLAKARVAEAM
eukprot:5156057-Ditylum_brightwellii.AAC.3